MRNLLILAAIFGVVGLVVGYLIFGRFGITNELIPLHDLFSSGDGILGEIGREVAGFADKRQSIYISGGVGIVVGVALGFVLRRRR
ncbi:MAG: hypothetical protein KOO61_01910 [Spirochaetales bacterium]|nr:hypothetical protein [Spirochaetales bacterium]